MDVNQRPTDLILEILANGGVLKFAFDSILKARRFQQSLTGTINRMLKTKTYDGYWSYLDNLRVLKEDRAVYVGPKQKMPKIYGDVKIEQIAE